MRARNREWSLSPRLYAVSVVVDIVAGLGILAVLLGWNHMSGAVIAVVLVAAVLTVALACAEIALRRTERRHQ